MNGGRRKFIYRTEAFIKFTEPYEGPETLPIPYIFQKIYIEDSVFVFSKEM